MKFEFLYPALVRATPPRSSTEKRCYVVMRGEVDLPVYGDRDIPFVARARGFEETRGFRSLDGGFFVSVGEARDLVRVGSDRGRRLGATWRRMTEKVRAACREGDALSPKTFRDGMARGDLVNADLPFERYDIAGLSSVDGNDLDYWRAAAEEEMTRHFVCGSSLYAPTEEPFIRVGFGFLGTEIGVGYYDDIPETRVYPYTSDRTYHPYYAFFPFDADAEAHACRYLRRIVSDTRIEALSPGYFGHGWQALELDRSARALAANMRRDLRDNRQTGGWVRGMPLDVRNAWDELFRFTETYSASDGVPEELADRLSDLRVSLENGKGRCGFSGVTQVLNYEYAMHSAELALEAWESRPVTLDVAHITEGTNP